ncbi:MAG: protein jag [Lachnospiraceae bacterium]|nr:protein jag [Lachnospiraceae bacterium]
MKNSIRVSAKDIDDAITDAMVQLGVTSDKLEYEVIEKGSSGFLGIGMKQAVIEAWRKSDRPQKVENEKSDAFVTKGVKKSAKIEKPVKEEIKKSKEIEKAIEEPVEVELVEITIEAKKAVEDFLIATLTAMGLTIELTMDVDSYNVLCVDVKGENMGLIIGKRGQTLDSLQYLANRVVNKYQTEYIRVKLDTENYRARREETLTRLARNLASKVKRTRRPVSLEPMNPYERRIIHSVLQSNPYVSTHSEGEEPYRKVVITLKR